jgi:leucine efflux protein
MVLKWAGAGYLAYLGIRMVLDAVRAWRSRGAAVEASVAEAPAEVRPFRRALLVSLINPKAILFLISFFTQFVDPAYPRPAVTFLVLGSIVQIFSFTYLSTLIFAGTRLSSAFRRRRRLTAAGTTAVGALFIGFGLKLATSTM